MRILRDYILKEFLHSFLLSLVVFTFAFLIGNIIQIANLVINKGVSIVAVCKLLFFMTPWLLSFTFPMASITSVILTFGRFSSDGELTAMRASGVSLYRIALPVLMLGALISSSTFILNDQISSNASYASRRIVKEIGIRSPAAYLEAGTFIRGFENYVIFIYEVKGNKFKNIRIYQPQEGKPTRTIVAESGEIDTFPEKNLLELRLFNGTSEEPAPTDPDNFYKMNFKSYYMTVDLSKVMKQENIEKKAREMTMRELRAEVAKSVSQNIDPAPLFVEMYKKINMSIASFVLILIGIPLGIRAHRSEKSIGFGISLILFAMYWGLFLGGIALSLKGVLPPWAGVSLPNIVFFVAGAAILVITARR
ncbi:MAG: LptF/LptG family permease [Candidatus Omnitrophota bacterium]|nr:LptF/LptG family permease [Candidatus Omnitrophota bacterium]